MGRSFLLLSLVAVTSLVTVGRAQGADPSPTDEREDVGEWRRLRRRWTVPDGLPQTSVTSLARPAAGYLWLTTEAGVARFDGVDFRRLDADRHAEPLLDDAVGVAVLGEDRVCVWCVDGAIHELDAVGRHVRRLVAPGEPPVRAVRALGADRLLVRADHVDRFSADGSVLERWLDAPGAELRDIADAGDGVWFAGGARGLFRRSVDGRVARVDGPWGAVRSVCGDPTGGVWVGGSAGLVRVDRDGRVSAAQEDGLPSASILEVVATPDGDVWIGTVAAGAQLLPGGRPGAEMQVHARGATVFAVAHDPVDDVVWVGTEALGLLGFERVPIRVAARSTRDAPHLVTAVHESDDGALWVGGAGGFVGRRGAGDDRFESFPTAGVERPVLVIRDIGGRPLVGGQDGLFRVQEGRLERVAATRELGSVRDLVEFGGAVWIATANGLFRWDGDDVVVPVDLGVERPDVWCLEAAADRLFAGLVSGGLFELRFTGGAELAVASVDDSGAVPARLLVTALHANDDVLWVGGIGGDLWMVAAGRITPLPIDPRIDPIHVLGIRTDGRGHVAAVVTTGLLRFRADDGARIAAGELATLPVDYLPCSELVRIDEFNGMSGGAVASGVGGVLHCAGLGGVVTFGLHQLRDAPPAAAVCVDSFLVDGADIGPRDGVFVVPADAQRVSVRFRTSSVLRGGRTFYRCRLLGSETDWVEVDATALATFPRAGPGDYVLEAQTGDTRGWTGPVRRFPVRVEARFLESLLGRALVVGGLLALVASAWTWRSIRERRRRGELEHQVMERTAALAAEVVQKRAAEAELRRSRDELDERVRQRTAELDAVNRRLRSELEQREALQAELVRAQKREGLARFSGGVAHDLNNLLTAIYGFTAEARAGVEPDSDVDRDLVEVERTTGRAARLVGQLLAFSRQQPFAAERVDVGERLRSLWPVLEQLVGPERSFEMDVAAGPASVWVDPQQLEQVITNLVVNARDATAAGGSIRVSVRGPSSGLPNAVELAVEDDGRGLDAETESRIFDPFFSTKEGGSGLGLSICHGIVTKAGGRIEVRSRLGEGTAFRVVLPASSVDPTARAARAMSEPAVPTIHARDDRGTIVVVDDQPTVLRALERTLRRAGFDVITCERGADAIAAVVDPSTDVAAVVSDVAMPGMDGISLVRALRARGAEAPVVLITGFTTDDGLARTLGDDVRLLRKPFAPDELVRVLDEATLQ